MIYKIIYRNDIGVYECIVAAESEFEALLLVKKENPIDGKFDVKEVTEITGSGVLSTKTIKIFKRPENWVLILVQLTSILNKKKIVPVITDM